jgi:uncharacterized protein (TIRG00374 family)
MAAKAITLAAGIVITIATLYLAFNNTDFEAIGMALANARLIYVLPFALLLAGFYVLKCIRWHWLLRANGRSPPLSTLVGPMMIGFAANNLLPLRIGELIRIWLAARNTNLAKGTVLASILVERLMDVAAILILASVAMGFGGGVFDHPLKPYLVPLAAAAAPVILLIAYGSRWFIAIARRVAGIAPGPITTFVLDKLRTFDDGVQAIRSPTRLVLTLANSIIQWSLLATTILLSCLAVGIHISLAASIFLMLLLTIAVSIPSTPGFVGVIEYSFVLGLGILGIPAESALAAAIFYHVINWGLVTATGTIYMHKSALRWTELSRAQI